MYEAAYFPLAGAVWALGAWGRLPRVKPSTKGEGHERRYFYGSVWAMCIAQPVLWGLWRGLPRGFPWPISTSTVPRPPIHHWPTSGWLTRRWAGRFGS